MTLINKMIRIVTILLLSAFIAGCSSTQLENKPWHRSPSGNPRSSTLYPFVEWSMVQKINPGMTIDEAKALVFELQSYHHPVNAILFTEYQGDTYEVALKISKDQKTIEDISYKIRK